MELTEFTVVARGMRGIFESIEKKANRFNAKCLIALAVICAALDGLTLIVDKSEYMLQVTIATIILTALCLSAGIYCLRSKKESRYRKYWLFLVWFVALGIAASSVDSSVILLYAIPVILAIFYNSVILTLFVSVLNIVFAFFPFLINTYQGTFPLDYVVLYPNTTITVADMSLDGAVSALGEGINRTETIMNMLTYGYLATVLFLAIISAIAVVVTVSNRQNMITQYNRARNLVEENER